MAVPIFLGAITKNAGAKIVLEYNQALAATTPLVTDYVVLVNAVSNPVTSVTVVGSTVELVPTTPLLHTTTNLLDYTHSIGHELQNALAELAADLVNETIHPRDLSVSVQPAGALNGRAFTTQPIVQIIDPVASAIDTTDNTTVVVASIASGTGVLSGTVSKTVVAGVATFTDLKITGTLGNFTLTFTPEASQVPVTSASFALTVSDLILYDANGATGGTVPVDALSPYIPGATVTVLGNTGNLVKTGSTFVGWSTRADGGATIQLPASTFVASTGLVMYAQWSTSILQVTDGAVSTNFAATQQPIFQNNGPGILALGSSPTNLALTGLLVPSGSTFIYPSALIGGAGAVFMQAIGSSCDVRRTSV